ncbi:MAG: serine/threonine protein kinase, partial [Deltaproteobacteria bacterium]|nr:serine/threonine protein kinase [Deltaproteobacteria bacterium]
MGAGESRGDDPSDELERRVTPLRSRRHDASGEHEALALSPPRPARWVDDTSGSNSSGRRRGSNSSGRRRGSSPRGTSPRRGTQIQRYVVIDRIDGGGMGDVFIAYDPQLDRRLAVKVLRDQPGVREDFDHERLRREGQALAQLSHPNVVTIYDVGEWNERTFIAMELVDGTHLGQWLRRRPRTQSEILAVFVAAGRGLAAAHAADIIHRDFKPSNVVVEEGGRVIVLDFGLAMAGTEGRPLPGSGPTKEPSLHDDPLTETGRTVGTPPYMAPEQHRGKALDARTDQFSYCVSLYEALVGQRPFPGHDVSTLVKAKLGRHLPPLPEPSPIPPWLRPIITRGLSPNPSERYPSMDALLHELDRGRDDPTPRRRRVLLTAAATTVVGLGAWWAWPQPVVCDNGRDRVGEVWDSTKAQQMQGAFAQTDIAYAQEMFERTTERLDAYATDWADHHRETCRALQ